MSTKLTRYAEGLMEAAWIAAIILTPLFFNKYSSRIFEPDKATLLRTLALIVLAAWLIKLLDTGLGKNRDGSWRERLRELFKTPIIPLVLATALAYTLATIFSVTPRISFWGSYPRLQGWYTASAYWVMFASLVFNLRQRTQVERLITAAILTSLPVSYYGVLQKNGIDPIPWGGDVTQRVASHMGNAIFVGAYLIVVIPLALVRIITAFKAILREETGLIRHMTQATLYISIAILQIWTLILTQSRGPLIGFLVGSVFLAFLLSLHWRKRWLMVGMVGLAAAAGAFLIIFNLPNSPLEDLRSDPYIGRLGRVFENDSGTGLVRVLIWEGAAEMVLPHQPLVYPDGRLDPFNFLRPLLGYGPETMHMAYNPFYPPQLAQVEKRNASPDRSHNETWDSLVITGLFGLLAYLGLYAAIFFYGFKWLGWIQTRNQRSLFFGLFFGGGLASAIGFILWQGPGWFGAGLPFGLVLGLFTYLILRAFFLRDLPGSTPIDSARALTLIMLLAAIMAHFVEINFAIAIVSTRTHFWIYAALLLAVGHFLPQTDQYALHPKPVSAPLSSPGKRKHNRLQPTTGSLKRWLDRETLIASGITILLLVPMFYEYIGNMFSETQATTIFWSSLTRVDANTSAIGVLLLLGIVWLAASILLTSQLQPNPEKPWWRSLLVILGASLLVSVLYGLLLSGRLAALARSVPQTMDDVMAHARAFEGLLLQFYMLLIVLLLGLGSLLPEEWPQRSPSSSPVTPVLAPFILLFAIILAANTNWQIIQADITFKMADPFAATGQWQVAIELYKRSKELAPDEDYYDLFTGRAYLEYSKTLSDAAEIEAVFNTARGDLERAQETNPLNPDHTANLARLHSWWATQAADTSTTLARGLVSDAYYERVLALAPQNARLWDEWAILNQTIIGRPERALELLEHSLTIDPEYDWTYALIGDYYTQIARKAEDETARIASYQSAIENYRKAITYASASTLRAREGLNYFYAIATTYQAMNDLAGLASILEESLTYTEVQSELWKIYDNLARTYFQLGESEQALQAANQALAIAPEAEQERIQALINTLLASPEP